MSTFPHLDRMGLPIVEQDELDGVDVAFSALPHKASAEACVAMLGKNARVVDIAADFRLHNVEEYEAWYQPHPAPSFLEEAVYGLPELHRDADQGGAAYCQPRLLSDGRTARPCPPC